MNDIFGKVVAILIAAVILCGMPLVYMQERLKSASQLYLLSETTRFVDSVCNTGFISREMMQQFYQKLLPVQGICEVSLLHETKELVYANDEDTYESVSTFYDETDIVKQLEAGKRYSFARNDYLRVTVCVDEGRSLLLWPIVKDETQNITYGGVIKFEAY